MAASKSSQADAPALDRLVTRHLGELIAATTARDPEGSARALTSVVASALPRATVYMVYAPAHGRKVSSVAAVAGPVSKAVPAAMLAPERFELGVIASGELAQGRVPGWPDVFHATVPCRASDGRVIGALVALTAKRLTPTSLNVLTTLASLGGAMRSPGTDSHSSPPTQELEALAAELNRQLVGGFDALPMVLARVTEAVGALGARCLVLDPDGHVEVIAAAGSARQGAAFQPDRELLQRLLAPRTVVRLTPSDAPMLSVPGAIELVVVPLVTQDAVQGGLVFAFERRQINPWVAMLLAEHMATVVLRSRQSEESAGTEGDWERALDSLDAIVWACDANHQVRRGNAAARKLLRTTKDATCRQVLGRQCPDVCAERSPATRVVVAAGGRYVVRALPIARTGGALYVALPESDETTADPGFTRRAAAGAFALAWAVEAETVLAGLDASLASTLQDLHRAGASTGLDDRVRNAWQGVTHLRRSATSAMEYLRKPPKEREYCDLRELLEVVIAVARAQARTPTDFRVQIGELPPVVGDRGRLLEALAAMARDATGMVEVVARVVDADIEIRMTGSQGGLPAMTDRVAREMEGLAVMDATGGINMRFPVRRASLPIGASMRTAVVEPDTDRPSSSDRRSRVLVVDDEPLILSAYARYLSANMDVTVVTATDGVEAIERMVEGEFDVILTDVMMPRKNGLDLYSEVSQRWPTMLSRIVFMTGAVFGAEAEDFLRTTANRVLKKPIEPSDLKETVTEILERAADWGAA